MPLDDDGDDELAGFGVPPEPSDRLWRHPSELAASSLPEPPTERRRSDRRPPLWGVALLAGAAGAVLCGGFLALTGRLGDARDRPVTEKVATAPVISFPALTEGADVAALAERVAPAIVGLHSTTGEETLEASGVVIRDDGVVLTSATAVDGWPSVTVVLAGGRRLSGEIVGADLPTDVAVVTVDGQSLPVAVLGVSDGLLVGAPTVALGAAEAGGEHPPRRHRGGQRPGPPSRPRRPNPARHDPDRCARGGGMGRRAAGRCHRRGDRDHLRADRRIDQRGPCHADRPGPSRRRAAAR